jgi:hypothetical protein
VNPSASSGVGFSATVFDALPFPAFIMDEDMRVLALNPAASRLVSGSPDGALRQRGGEALHCINSGGGCGQSVPCATCILRSSVSYALAGKQPIRRRTRLEHHVDGHVEEMHALMTAAPLEYEGAPRVLMIIENLTLLFAMTDALPICMGCKKVLNNDLWTQIEAYLDSHLDLKFSHGLCPDCSARLYPDKP